MKSVLYKYPLDPSGSDLRNRVRSEYHDISKYTMSPYKPVVLNHGHFYKEGLIIRDNHGRLLVLDRDYQLTGLNGEATRALGKEVYSAIVVTTQEHSTILYVDAQMVGGIYSKVTKQAIDIAKVLLNDTRPTQWDRIPDKPFGYVPTGHMQAWWSFYNFEEWRDKIKDITDKIFTKSTGEVLQLTEELLNQYDVLDQDRLALLALVNAHIARRDNPHRVTKAQAGLGLIENFPIANFNESVADPSSRRSDRYFSPEGSKEMIDKFFMITMMEHIENMNNPHQVTAHQADTYTKPEVQAKLSPLLNIGEVAPTTRRVGGLTPDQIKAQMLTNPIPADTVAPGVFDPNLFGSNLGNNRVLMGNRTYRNVSELLSQYQPSGSNVIYHGFVSGHIWQHYDSNAYHKSATNYAAIQAQYASQPVGTIVLFNDRWNVTWMHTNGNMWTMDYRPLAAMMRTASGWLGPYMNFNLVDWNP